MSLARHYRRFFDSNAAVMPVRARGAFVIALQKDKPQLKTHLAGDVAAVWESGRFVKFVATTKCQRHFLGTGCHVVLEPPDGRQLCDDCILRDFTVHCLYRFFDADGRLLYVGVTKNLLARLSGHKSAAKRTWWPLVRHTSYEEFPTRSAALAAEKLAILNELPLYNVEFTDRAHVPGRRRSAFAHLFHAPT